MNEFTHGGTDNGFAVLAIGFKAFTELTDKGVTESAGKYNALRNRESPLLASLVLPDHFPDYRRDGARPVKATTCLALIKP